MTRHLNVLVTWGGNRMITNLERNLFIVTRLAIATMVRLGDTNLERKFSGRKNMVTTMAIASLVIRVVATTPEKTHNQKFLTFETILKSQSIPRQKLP